MTPHTIARAGLHVGRIGLGTAPLAGLFDPVSADAACSTMDAAWAGGVRLFDTAPHYGVGLAERRLGEFLRTRLRAEAVISTKVGRVLVPGAAARGDDSFYGVPEDLVRVRDYSADGVHRSIADSLARTGLDRFDVVLIHDPDEHWAQAVDEAYPALARLRAEGVVGAIGVGMNQAEMLTRFVRETDIDVVLMAGRYTLLDRGAEAQLLPLCQQRGVAVLIGGVFNSGVLANPTPAAHFDYAPVRPRTLNLALAMQRLCADHGVPLAAAAVQFPLRHPAVTSVLVGARSADEIRADLTLSELPIPDELWPALDTLRTDQP